MCESHVRRGCRLPLLPWPRDLLPMSLDMQFSYTVIIEGRAVGWLGWGGVRGGKNNQFGHPMSSHDAHTVANDTIVGHVVNRRHRPSVPLFQL